MDHSERITACYDQHARAMYAHALVLTADASEAEEVLQSVFTRLIQKEDALAKARDERALLLKWVHDAAIDLIRSQSRRRHRNEHWQQERQSPFATGEDPDAEAYGKAVWTALQSLPSEQRAVVHLKVWEGHSFQQIADQLDLSINTVASRYRYGIDKMRDRLRPLYEELKDSHGCI